jgi:hypothetical protein
VSLLCSDSDKLTIGGGFRNVGTQANVTETAIYVFESFFFVFVFVFENMVILM